MEEFEKEINAKYGESCLPKIVVDKYIKLAKEHEYILDEELEELPDKITFKDLKKKLEEFRKKFFTKSWESFDNEIVCGSKENLSNNRTENLSNLINGFQNKAGESLVKEKTMYHTIEDEKSNFERKKQRILNILKAYYAYEIMKIKKQQREKIKKHTYNYYIGCTIGVIVLMLATIVLLIDVFEINKPY